MSTVTIKQLLEAGVHFGHQTQRWNPKMKKYIFGERNGIYIINLEITLACTKKVLEYVKSVASEGKELLFIGTKKQAQESIRSAAMRSNMPFVQNRWLGGMLTNFDTIRKSVSRLDEIDKMEEEGSFKFVTKKEVGVLKKSREKLLKNLEGIRKMRRLPAAVFVIDSKNEEIAIKEAIKLGIPVIGLLDTNSDPDMVDHPIPGNDDAIRAIRLFCDLIADAIIAGRAEYEKNIPVQQPAEESAEEIAPETPSEESEAKKEAAPVSNEAAVAAGPEKKGAET